MTDTPYFVIDDLTIGYHKVPVIRDISVKVQKGEIIALIGPNGVGKSTLIKIIVGEEQPDTGFIRYGSNVDIGYYDQHQSTLHADKTVLDEIWDRFPQMEQSNVRGALGMFLFTGDDVFKPIHTLSGGEKGRVALTALMLRKDNLLLLDEPSLGLAPLIVNEVINIIQQINKEGITVLLVEQNARKALKIADHACVIQQGRIVRYGTGAEILQEENFLSSYLGNSKQVKQED